MNSALTLGLKFVLTPVLIGAATLVGRRWGSAVGGWLIGLPFTSAPIALFLALDQGPRFAAAAADATMAGAISQAAFCVAYSWSARRSAWALSILAGTLAYGVATAALVYVPLRGGPMFVVIIAVLVLSIFLMPVNVGMAMPSAVPQYPPWDLPARMVVATALVVVLTAIAPVLGPRVAGLLAPFPLYGAVLAAFAHRMTGPGAAADVLRGLLLGLFAFAAFFLVLSGLLPYGIAAGFGFAIVTALVVQGASLTVGRRLRLA